MSRATKSTHLLVTLMLVTAALLSCWVRMPVRGQEGGRSPIPEPKPPLPKARPPRQNRPPKPPRPRDRVKTLINQAVELNRRGRHDDAIRVATQAIGL